MIAIQILSRARGLAEETNRDRNGWRTSGPVVLAAALVLAALTGLPLASVVKLIPQADDPSEPFLGI